MSRRIGVVTVARSDRGALQPLIDALAVQGLVLPWPDLSHLPETDLVVIFGDRWEMAAAAAVVAGRGIPIVHLHAGETTEAVIDDACRRAISELALHRVTANEEYSRRLAARGLSSVCLGAPGLARLPRRTYCNLPGDVPRLMLSFHPETRRLSEIGRQVNALARALEDLKAEVIITTPGDDIGREVIMQAFQDRFTHYEDSEWVAALLACDVLVGNSSCGIIEAPSIPLPAVNIGDRQTGRLKASSVIDVPHDRVAIRAGIAQALDPGWRAEHLTGDNPYGDRGGATRIAEFLSTCALS